MSSPPMFRAMARWGPPLVLAIAALGITADARAQTTLPARTDRSVYDTAGVIDEQHERAMEAINHELYAKAQVAIVVLTVPALENETIDQLAVRLGQTWGIGAAGRDRGLVIAFSSGDRRIFVATGYGTEGYLPDGRVGAILDQYVMPSLRANAFSDGLYRADVALAQASAQEYGVQLTGAGARGVATRAPRAPPGPLQIAFGVLALLGLAYLAIRHPSLFFFLLLSAGRGGRGGGGFGGGGGGFGGDGGGFGGGGAGRGF